LKQDQRQQFHSTTRRLKEVRGMKVFRFTNLYLFLLIATILTAGPVSGRAQCPGQGRTKLFLGPVPRNRGFTAPQPKDFLDSYRDIREQYAKKPEFQAELELVDRIDQADVALEIISRGDRDTGERSQAPTVITHGKKSSDPNLIVPGAVSPITENTLSARLVALKTKYSVDVDGRVSKGSYRELAKDLLQQVVGWVQQNRNAIQRP
jgi:hypothetical protein